MPYLHWETDRRRSKFEEIIRNITEEHERKEEKRLSRARSKVTGVTIDNPNSKATTLIPPEPAANKNSLWSVIKSKNDKAPCENPQTNEPVPKSFKPIHTLTELVEAKVKATNKRPLAIAKAEKKE